MKVVYIEIHFQETINVPITKGLIRAKVLEEKFDSVVVEYELFGKKEIRELNSHQYFKYPYGTNLPILSDDIRFQSANALLRNE